MHNRRMLAQACCFTVFAAGAIAYAASVSSTDRTFLNNAARIEMTGAHEGQLAENQAVRADVKDLGKMMVQDNSMSYSQLSNVAAKTGVTIPKGINTARNHAIEQLVSLKGPNFDRQFASDEVTSSRNAITVFEREAKHGKDPAVKAYAAKMVPVLENELKRAETVSSPTKRS